MSNPSCVRWLQIGNQSARGTAASTLYHVDFQDEFYPVTDVSRIERNDLRYDGEFGNALIGPKSGSVSPTLFLRGGGTAAGDGTAMVNNFEMSQVLNSLFGAVGNLGTGVISGTSHDTDTIKLAATANWPVGQGILIDSDSTAGSRYEAREVKSVSTDTSVDLDRALQGAPANAAVAYASTSYKIDPDTVDRAALHLTVDVEGDGFRRQLIDCLPKCKLVVPSAGPCRLETELVCGDWTDLADANPTYAANYDNLGTPLMGNGSIFWLGATKTDLLECTIDFGLTPTPHTSVNGTNGMNGFHMIYEGATFTGKIYDDSDSTLAEMVSGTGITTYDIAIQIGGTGTSACSNCVYIRIPVLDIVRANRENVGGVDVISFTGKARRVASGTGVSSLTMHVFGFDTEA